MIYNFLPLEVKVYDEMLTSTQYIENGAIVNISTDIDYEVWEIYGGNNIYCERRFITTGKELTKTTNIGNQGGYWYGTYANYYYPPEGWAKWQLKLRYDCYVNGTLYKAGHIFTDGYGTSATYVLKRV